jgi:hypothetical protein
MMSDNKMNIDQTIKRIYSLYIDIKTKEFDELKKDILMDDIKNLYVMVKALGTQNESIINEKHREILNDIEPVAIDIDTEKETRLEEEPSIVKQEEISVPNTEIKNEDSAFELSFIEEVVSPAEIKEENKPEITKEEVSKEVEANDTKKSFFSSGAIQDYLNKDEAPKKEIYDYLDLNTRIGLVEKFFKGNSIELSECLMKMNSKTSKMECIEILKNYQTRYGIDKKEEIYQTFVELLDRKFS